MTCRRWHSLSVGMTTQFVHPLTRCVASTCKAHQWGVFGYFICELCSTSIGTTVIASGSSFYNAALLREDY